MSQVAHASEFLELLDWRRRVAELFGELRQRTPDADTLAWFRAQKDALFREHPQSPIPVEQRAGFLGLTYWPYDAAGRVQAEFVPLEGQRTGGDVSFTRIGTLQFEFGARRHTLAAFWIEGYAGGLFVPFTDATRGKQTYGGGRYLLDTIKSADLGSDLATSSVILDFNYAYHPSCTYDPRWVCPLAPPDSHIPVLIELGERLP